MSIDRSLRTSGGLAGHRNVLSRAERIDKLTQQGRFDPATNTPTALAKVASRKATVGKKVKKLGEGEEGAVPGAAPAPVAAAAAAAPAGKAAGKGAGKPGGKSGGKGK